MIEEEYQRHRNLVDNSRFREKLILLIQNPNLAFNLLERTHGIHSCCLGTSVYVAGRNQDVKRLWIEAGYSLDDYSNALGDYICLPDEDRPGYVGEAPMELLQQTLNKSRIAPDTLVSFYWNIPNTEKCGFRLRHSGIFLGREKGRGIFFHQKSEGERFAITPVLDWASGFPQEWRDTMRLRFFSI